MIHTISCQLANHQLRIGDIIHLPVASSTHLAHTGRQNLSLGHQLRLDLLLSSTDADDHL